MTDMQNIEINAKQAAQAIGISQGTLRKLYLEERLGELVRNNGQGSHLHLVVRLGDLENLKAVVEEHTRRRRAVKAANGEIIMNKLDALARAIRMLAEGLNPDEHERMSDKQRRHAIQDILLVGGFDLSVESPEEVGA